MDPTLWTFLLSSPELAVPYPWERCFDIETGFLLYKSREDGTVIVDLRPRVNLGGGLYNVNNMWQILTGGHLDTAVNRYGTAAVLWPDIMFQRNINEYDQDTPIVICSNCCTGPIVTYLIVPQLVTHCPLCGCYMDIFR